jgi:hypothetical protein
VKCSKVSRPYQLFDEEFAVLGLRGQLTLQRAVLLEHVLVLRGQLVCMVRHRDELSRE